MVGNSWWWWYVRNKKRHLQVPSSITFCSNRPFWFPWLLQLARVAISLPLSSRLSLHSFSLSSSPLHPLLLSSSLRNPFILSISCHLGSRLTSSTATSSHHFHHNRISSLYFIADWVESTSIIMAPLPSFLLATLASTLLVLSVDANVDVADGYYPPPAYTALPPPVVTVPTYPPGGSQTSTAEGGTTTRPGTTTGVTCATPQISVSLITSLHVSTVSYVTTQTIVQSLIQSYCAPTTAYPTIAATCIAGKPVVTGGYTLTYSEVKPTPYVTPYLPDVDWESGSGDHLIASTVSIFVLDAPPPRDHMTSTAAEGCQDFYFGAEFQAYAEYKCQFQCGRGCQSWFVAFSKSFIHLSSVC